jgi:hypothetical protein
MFSFGNHITTIQLMSSELTSYRNNDHNYISSRWLELEQNFIVAFLLMPRLLVDHRNHKPLSIIEQTLSGSDGGVDILTEAPSAPRVSVSLYRQ